MKTLTELQIELKAILPQGIDLTFQALKNAIADGTDACNDVLLLESRYMEVNRQLLQGTLSNDDAQIEFNKIRKDLLEFIDCLQETFLKSEVAAGKGPLDRPDIYNGEVLYRIPKMMKKEQEVKCMVRLAFDRKVLVEDLEIQEEDVLKDIRISEVMGVELLDPSEGTAFAVRTINDTVQFVEKDLFTEWIFYVKPLAEGTHPLVLKISVIEIRNGVERKRNVVLEETIEIVATEPVAEGAAPAFVNSGYTVQFSNQAEHIMASGNDGPVATVPPPSAGAPGSMPVPPPVLTESPRKSGKVRKTASAMAALVLLLTAGWAIYMSLNPSGPPNFADVENTSEEDWDAIKENPTRDELEQYVIRYPESDNATIAQARLDSLENSMWQQALAVNEVAALQTYLAEYPDGVYARQARQMIRNRPLEIDSIGRGQEGVASGREVVRPSNITVTSPESGEEIRPAVPERIQEEPEKTREEPIREIKTPVPPKETPVIRTEPVKEIEPVTEPEEDEPISMRSASRLPVYPGCEQDDREREARCTSQKIGRFILRKLKYPEKAQDRQIEGTIEVQFVVERDGSITDVISVNDIGGGCAEEAVRLVKQLPQFIPGQNRAGEPARIRYKLPITFMLN